MVPWIINKVILIVTILYLINQSFVSPYIEPVRCEKYEHMLCNTDHMCKPLIIECEISDKPSHCFALWRTNNVTGEVTIQMKGCFTHNVACNQTECIDRSAHKKNGELNFCCCEGNLCNRNQKWIPTTEITDNSEPKNLVPDNLQQYIIYAVISLTVVFAFITVTLFVYVFLQRKQAAITSETNNGEINEHFECLTLRPIELLNMKARGRFGVVWRAQMKPAEVAVKIFSLQEKNSWGAEYEIYKLAGMQHSNILEFIAAEKHLADNLTTEFWLVTAYHSNGSLFDFLKSNTINWSELSLIAESMTRGLTYLHEEIKGSTIESSKPSIAHRDFKSKNVLLKHDLSACIADFGLALVFRPGQECGDIHGQVGTYRYMAPEVLEGAINFTRDSFLRIDVYACGLILWELVSRCTAHNNVLPCYALPFESELGLYATLEEMQEYVAKKKLRPNIQKAWRNYEGLSAMCDTIEECWDHDTEARLSSSCVLERIVHNRKHEISMLQRETNGENSTDDSIENV